MPNKSVGNRGRRKYLKGILTEDMQLGTLASKALVAQISSDTVVESTWLSSVKCTWAISDLTPADGAGPIMVGVAHSDYSATEIEEFIENANSWNEGDLVAQEIAKRKIRIVGILVPEVAGAVGDGRLNDGKPITTKCGWILTTGNGVDIWAYNMGDVALGTTDPQVSVNGHANLWPR